LLQNQSQAGNVHPAGEGEDCCIRTDDQIELSDQCRHSRKIVLSVQAFRKDKRTLEKVVRPRYLLRTIIVLQDHKPSVLLEDRTQIRNVGIVAASVFGSETGPPTQSDARDVLWAGLSPFPPMVGHLTSNPEWLNLSWKSLQRRPNHCRHVASQTNRRAGSERRYSIGGKERKVFFPINIARKENELWKTPLRQFD
jgi:hypothetical protein